jgi:hypothetical protein
VKSETERKMEIIATIAEGMRKNLVGRDDFDMAPIFRRGLTGIMDLAKGQTLQEYYNLLIAGNGEDGNGHD